VHTIQYGIRKSVDVHGSATDSWVGLDGRQTVRQRFGMRVIRVIEKKKLEFNCDSIIYGKIVFCRRKDEFAM